MKTKKDTPADSMAETMYLTGIPGMREKLIEGMNANREDLIEIDLLKESGGFLKGAGRRGRRPLQDPSLRSG